MHYYKDDVAECDIVAVPVGKFSLLAMMRQVLLLYGDGSRTDLLEDSPF